MYSKIRILYFSATGNTRLVSEKLSGFLTADGFDVQLISVEDKEALEKLDFDNCIFLFGFPCYAFEYPKAIFDSVFERIGKQSRPVPAFVFATYCLKPGMSIKAMANTLRNYNFTIVAKGAFKCPSSGFVSITSHKTRNLKYRLLKKVMVFDENLIHKIRAFKDEIAKAALTYNLPEIRNPEPVSPFEHVPRILAKWNEHRIFCGYRIIANRCFACGVCAMNCPTGNILIRDGCAQFISNSECLRCMRCISNCPQNAVLLGKATENMDRYTSRYRESLYNAVKRNE